MTPERWETLAQAFEAYHFDPDNLPFVQRLVDAVGIDHYEEIRSRGYIKAIRRDRGRPLHIHWGYTHGFPKEEDILAAVGDVWREKPDRWWYVVHPRNDVGEHHRGAASGARETRAAKICPSCGNVLPLSGLCDFCG